MICVDLGRSLKVPKTESELFGRAIHALGYPYLCMVHEDHNKYYWPVELRVAHIQNKALELEPNDQLQKKQVRTVSEYKTA